MRYLTAILCCFYAISVWGQSDTDLLDEAKRLSANLKYAEALQLIEEGLDRFPGHHDLLAYQVRVLLWDKKYDLAKEVTEKLLQQYPKDAEGWELRLTSSFWQADWERLLADVALAKSAAPETPGLNEYKLQAFMGLKRYKDAREFIAVVNDPSLAELAELVFFHEHHSLSIRGEHAQFSEVFTPWTHLSAAYGRRSRHSWIASVSHARMFDQNGLKVNVDAYPRLTRSAIAHVEGGYSPSDIFAHVEVGGEWIQSVQKWEIAAGTKFFRFRDEDVFLYKAGLGYYLANDYLHYRVYYNRLLETPSWTHLLTLRHILTNQFHYIQLQGSLGSTPVQITNLLEVQRLDARAVFLSYKHLFVKSKWMLDAGVGFQRETYIEEQRRDRINVQLGISKLL